MKYKAFFISFKWLSMTQITQFFLERESPTLNYEFTGVKQKLFNKFIF